MMRTVRAFLRLAWRRRFVVSDVEAERATQVTRFTTRAAAEDAARQYTRATGHATVVQRVTRLLGLAVCRRSYVAYAMHLYATGQPRLREIRVEV